METQLSQTGDITVVKISGRLDIDQTGVFRRACIANLSAKKVVFFLSELTFVGSTGIQSFFQIVQELHSTSPHGVRIVGLNPDFQRIFRMTAETNTAVCLSHMTEALDSFQAKAQEFSCEAPVDSSRIS